MALYPLALDAILENVAGSGTAETTVKALVSTVSTKIMEVNLDRTSFLVVNSSNVNAFFGFTNAVSLSVYTFAVPRNSYFEFATAYPWTGELWGLSVSACNITLTEISK